MLSIAVSEPQAEGDGLAKKTTYLITTQLEYKGTMAPPQTYVYQQRRRFNEFATTYNLYKAYLKEPFPEKKLLGRFSDDTVEQRKASFDKILKELVSTKPGVLCEKEMAEFLGIGNAITKFIAAQKYFLGVSCKIN